MLFNGRRFIVAASPELKLHTTDEADTAHMVSSYRQLASRDTYFIPTSFKSPQSLRPIRARDTAYLKSYATDVLITPCLSPCFVEGSNGSKAKIVWHLSMLLEILVMNIVVLSFIFPKCFLSKLFFKIFFPTFFSQILA